jgi:hypothetical protein
MSEDWAREGHRNPGANGGPWGTPAAGSPPVPDIRNVRFPGARGRGFIVISCMEVRLDSGDFMYLRFAISEIDPISRVSLGVFHAAA